MPRLKEGDLEKVSRLYKAKTGVGCDGFHPKVPLDLTSKKRRNRRVLGEGGTVANGHTSLHDDVPLIPKNVTSERSIALMPTLIRWWEVLRAPEVAKWQQKYRAEWDASDGRNGGAQRTVWEVFV